MNAHLALPWLTWLLLGVPALALARIVLAWRRRKKLAMFAQPLSLAVLLPPKSRWRWLRALLVSFGLTFLLIGAAGPRWGQGDAPEVVPGRDIVLVLDMSRSMLATDAPPTRFDRGREALIELVQLMQRRGGHRLALIVFGSDAQIVVPLTHDYRHVLNKLESLDVETPPARLRPRSDAKSGTRLGAAVQLAGSPNLSASPGFQDVIVVSDGDDPLGDADWQDGLRSVAELGIPFHTVGIGDPERTSVVPERPDASTRLREHPLREIARQTGGHYIAARRDAPRLVEFFKQRIESKPGTVIAGDTPPQPKLQSVWLYLAATVLLAGAWLVGSYD